MQPFIEIPKESIPAIEALPEDKQLAGYASAGKLDAFVAARGITQDHFARCLGTKALAMKLAEMGQAATKAGVTGTPTFFIDGTLAASNTWTGLEPLLRTALHMKPKAG